MFITKQGIINNKELDIYKKPKTDDGTKNSAKGLILVYESFNRVLEIKDQCTWHEFIDTSNLLKTVYRDGYIHRLYYLDAIRKRIYDKIGESYT